MRGPWGRISLGSFSIDGFMRWALFGLRPDSWLGLLGGLRLEIALLRYGERDGACGGQSVEVMGGVSGINSLRYILLCGVRPSVGGILCPPRGAGRSGYRSSARHKEEAYSTLRVSDQRNSVRCSFHSDRPAGTKVGRPAVGRMGADSRI